MPNPENKNLFFLENGTEMHMNPKELGLLGLRELLRYEIFAEFPAKIILVANCEKLVLSPSTIRKARELFGKDRRRFLDKTTLAMYDAEEIIILGKPDIKRSMANKLRDPRYDNVFKNFINNNPYLPQLGR